MVKFSCDLGTFTILMPKGDPKYLLKPSHLDKGMVFVWATLTEDSRDWTWDFLLAKLVFSCWATAPPPPLGTNTHCSPLPKTTLFAALHKIPHLELLPEASDAFILKQREQGGALLFCFCNHQGKVCCVLKRIQIACKRSLISMQRANYVNYTCFAYEI